MIRKQKNMQAGQSLSEFAFAFPIIMLATMGLITLGLVGFAAINASNAANFGARMGSVAQTNPVTVAQTRALMKLAAVPVGTYTVAVSGGGAPGEMIVVRVDYRVPNFFYGLGNFFGVATAKEIEGSTYAYFRKEGW
jgi:hypothetical protein